MTKNLGRNLLWGLAWGLGTATLFSLYVVVLALVRGTWEFEKFGVTGTTILATYYAAGAIGGIVVGLLRPTLHHWLGSMVVGILAGMFVYGGISRALDGRIDFLMAAVIGLMVGGPAAILFWHREWRRRQLT
jgi:hypothetical protein